jgi:Protein of unknown function (DUF1559)
MTSIRRMFAATWILTAVLISSGIGLHAMDQRPEPAHADAATAGPAQEPPGQRDEADRKARVRSLKSLKTIAVAMLGFAAATGERRLPPTAIRKNGKPLLSWRVAILPYLGQQALYDKFHLDEPWNSPHNKKLLTQMPDVYAPVVRFDEPRISTYYQVFTGPGTLFEDELGPRLRDVKDRTSSTLMVVEAGSPVPWTKPEDIPFDGKKPMLKLGRQFADGFHIVFVDSAAMFVRKEIPAEFLRALITRSGGEDVNFDRLRPFMIWD